MVAVFVLANERRPCSPVAESKIEDVLSVILLWQFARKSFSEHNHAILVIVS